jgi:hypothetical protein
MKRLNAVIARQITHAATMNPCEKFDDTNVCSTKGYRASIEASLARQTARPPQ